MAAQNSRMSAAGIPDAGRCANAPRFREGYAGNAAEHYRLRPVAPRRHCGSRTAAICTARYPFVTRR